LVVINPRVRSRSKGSGGGGAARFGQKEVTDVSCGFRAFTRDWPIARSVECVALRSAHRTRIDRRDSRLQPLEVLRLARARRVRAIVLIGCGEFAHWWRTGETVPYTSFITVSVGGVPLGMLLAAVAMLTDLIAG